MSYFNEDQEAYMRSLATVPRSQLCGSGWHVVANQKCDCGPYRPSVDDCSCLFCGGAMAIYWLPDSEPEVCHLGCKCGASGPWAESETEATETWRKIKCETQSNAT